MSVHRTFHALRRTPLRLVLAMIVAASLLGVGQVAFAVTDADVKAAAKEARDLGRDLDRQDKSLAKLRDDAADAAARQARAEVEVKDAQTVANGGEAPQKGLFGGLFGSKDPQERLASAQAELAAAKEEANSTRLAVAKAESETAGLRARAEQAAAKETSLTSQLSAAEQAVAAQAQAKRRAGEDLQAATANHARAEATVSQLAAKVTDLKGEVTTLEKRKIESLALVRAATEVATHAEEAGERRKAVAEMRRAEAEAADVIRSLDRSSYDLGQAMKKQEAAELAAAQTRSEVQMAERAYEPYAAAERAAAAAAERAAAAESARIAAEQARAEQEKMAVKQREEAEKAAAIKAKEEEKARKMADAERMKAEEAAAKAAAAKAKEEERARKVAETERMKAEEAAAKAAKANAAAPQVAVQPAPNKQPAALVPVPVPVAPVTPVATVKPVVVQPPAAMTPPAVPPINTATVTGQTAAERAAQLDAERRQQEEMIEKAVARAEADKASREEAERQAAAAAAAAREAADAAEKAELEKARAEHDADKIKRIEAERAERARLQQEAVNRITQEGPYNKAPEHASARAAEAGNVKYDICAVVVTGDREAVYALKNWADYENDALYQPMSDADIESFRQRILKDLQDGGYVFATVSIFKPSLQLGFLKMRAHVGQQGDVTVKGNRWHTAKQILEAASWQTGGRFNYRELYTDIFDLNVRPDLQINTKLKPRMDEFGNRIVDVELEVQDAFPIHGSMNLANTGTRETSDWRLRTTLQHLNLTKQDDILTLEWLTDPDNIKDVNAFSGSYHLPIGDKSSLTVFGGWSESDYNNVLPLVDVLGKGWYSGIQYGRVLAENKTHRFDATLGWLYQDTQNQTNLGGIQYQDRASQLSMPMITLGYSDKEFDSLGGRNFFSNTVMANFAGHLGAGYGDQATKGVALSDGSFFIDRFEMARFQRFFAGDDAPGKWSLFMKLDGQISDDSLVASVQKGIGGADSVRGYQERELIGDNGLSGTMELRTPLVDNFIPGLRRDPSFMRDNPDHWSAHRMQFVMFSDFGVVQQNVPAAGQEESETMASVGAGLRLGLTKYSQLRFDYGVPMEATPQSDNSGRGHVSLQLQF